MHLVYPQKVAQLLSSISLCGWGWGLGLFNLSKSNFVTKEQGPDWTYGTVIPKNIVLMRP